MSQDYIVKRTLNPAQNQESLATRNSYYHLIPPRSGCIYRSALGRFCRSRYCVEHGNEWRYRDYNWDAHHISKTANHYSVSNRYDYPITPIEYRQSLDEYLSLMWNEIGDFEYVQRLHFVNNIPHLHATISILLHTMPNRLNKRIWNIVLRQLGHPKPNHANTYCRQTQNYEKWLRYMHQCEYKVLPLKYCPPKTSKGERQWRTHSSGKMTRRKHGHGLNKGECHITCPTLD